MNACFLSTKSFFLSTKRKRVYICIAATKIILKTKHVFLPNMIKYIHPFKAAATHRNFPRLLVILNVLFWTLVFNNTLFAQAPVTYNTPGNYIWVCPPGVTSITVECWGAGGGGGQRTNNGVSGGGGGGGYASSVVTVTPGNSYDIVVGAGGSGGPNNKNGENSRFGNSLVVAAGGNGGVDNSTVAGIGGGSLASIGAIRYNGGNGTAGTGNNGGAGGGAAGRNGAGNGVNSGGLYSGNGGATQSTNNGTGNPGAYYGAGGSGIRRSSNTRPGGNGAGGLILITFNEALWQNPIISTNNIDYPATVTNYTNGDIVTSGITVFGISKGGGLGPQNTLDKHNSSSWSTSSSSNSNDYLEFTLSPQIGSFINLTHFNFTGQRTSNGPESFGLRSSLDGFTNNIAAISNNNTVDPFERTVNLSGITSSSTITFRLYAWGASNTSGQFSVNDFAFFGTVEALTVLWQNPITGVNINPQTTNPYTTGDIFAANLGVSGITKGTGLTGNGTTDRYNAHHWNGGTVNDARNNDDFFGFTLTPYTGYVINFQSFAFTGQRDNNSSSPTTFALRSSLDNYSSNITTFSVSGTLASTLNFDLSGATFQDVTGITFRIYGWGGSTNTDRRFSVNDFTFYGTIREVPAPSITSFTPSNYCIGESTSVVISGTNFELVQFVRFGSVEATYTVNSNTQITANIPNGLPQGTSMPLSVGTPGGIASLDGFTVYSVGNEVKYSATFEDNNLTGWNQSPANTWASSNSNPITSTRSLYTSSNNNWTFFGSDSYITSISRPLTNVDELSAKNTTWRFNTRTKTDGNAAQYGSQVYFVLASDDGNLNNGYAVRLSYNYQWFFFIETYTHTITLCKLTNGVATNITTPYSFNYYNTNIGFEITRDPSGNWEIKTDNNGGFDALASRGTGTDTQYSAAAFLGVKAALSYSFGFSTSAELRIDDIEISQSYCEDIYYSRNSGNETTAIWHRERSGGTPYTVNNNNHKSFVVQANHTVNVDGNWAAKNVTIENNGVLSFSDAKNLTVYENLVNQGTISSGTGTIRFDGTAAQVYSSSSDQTLNNVVANNAVSVSFPSNVVTNIKPNGVVSILRGTFNTGNNLVLRSSSLGTASIGTIATGSSLTGQVTLERFLPNLTAAPLVGNGSWIAIGTPLTGATVQQWNETVVTTGYAGADYAPPSYYFNNIRWYKESDSGDLNTGYVGVQSNNEVISAKRGYFHYTYANLPAPQNMLRVKGNIQQGTFNDTLSYTNTGSPASDGWNLLVNRYPSEVDFKAIAEAGAGGVKTYYLYNAEGNNYKAYTINSVGSAPQYIASGQAIFVKATATGQTLQYREAFKTNTGTAFERNNNEASYAAIRFFKAANSTDECVLNFNDNATGAYEYDYDAEKIPSQEAAAAECALVSEDGKRLTIDSRPLSQEGAISIPIFVKMPNSGTYRLRIDETANLPFGSCLFVEDLVTGNTIPLAQGQELVIAHTGNYSGNRFLIHATPSIATIETNLDCFGAANGSIELTLPQGEWSLAMADTLGNSFNTTEGTTAFENLPAGQYIVSATNALNNCPSSQKNISISEPAEMVLTLLNSNVDNCNASSNAAIEWKVSNATNYDYAVSNQAGEVISRGIGGSGSIILSDLAADIYTVTINSYCGTQSFETSLIDTNVVNVEILSENILLALLEGTSQTMTIEQSNQNATNFVWILSNDYTSSNESFNYEFIEPGDYVLKLTAHNNHCLATDSISIYVDRAVGISEEATQTPISFLQTKESLEMYLNISSSDMTTVTVYDVSGRKVWSLTTSTWNGKNISIGTGSFASGIYVIKTTVGDKEVLNKKFINP